jgi:hypothetical protein
VLTFCILPPNCSALLNLGRRGRRRFLLLKRRLLGFRGRFLVARNFDGCYDSSMFDRGCRRLRRSSILRILRNPPSLRENRGVPERFPPHCTLRSLSGISQVFSGGLHSQEFSQAFSQENSQGWCGPLLSAIRAQEGLFPNPRTR